MKKVMGTVEREGDQRTFSLEKFEGMNKYILRIFRTGQGLVEYYPMNLKRIKARLNHIKDEGFKVEFTQGRIEL